MRRLLLVILLVVSIGSQAQDSIPGVKQPTEKSWLRRVIEGFTYIDTNYVEPQHYDWSVMVQGIYNYDYYRLSSVTENHQSITFAPTAAIKVGPYFGWRWAFFGYTFDLRHVDLSSNSKKLDFSFYSAQIGADIYYRRTGSDYRIRNVNLGGDVDTDALENASFDGINVGITGVNVYYIFNHKRFSYPAAFNQSTCQKLSCGSWMVGLGYLRNSIEFDADGLQRLVDERLGRQDIRLDSALRFNSVKYHDISLSVGYGYNWVFARNWLLASSLSMALAYKKTYSESSEESSKRFNIREFSISNVNIDGVGRFGLVWNNTRWYAGLSAIIRAYNYKKERFAANNIFGSLNIYAGYNFGAKKEYRKNKKNR